MAWEVFLSDKVEWVGTAWTGSVELGLEGRGKAWNGRAMIGEAWEFFPHKEAWLGWAGCGVERSGEARFLFLLEVM